MNRDRQPAHFSLAHDRVQQRAADARNAKRWQEREDASLTSRGRSDDALVTD
jgi:hypothetical protein